MRKSIWTWVIGAVIVVVLWLVLGRGSGSPAEPQFDPKAAALTRFEEVNGEGVDLSSGPCLGVIGPDWVADVVHDPRQPTDDDPAHQCLEYRAGKVKHLVELTPDGKVIRVR